MRFHITRQHRLLYILVLLRSGGCKSQKLSKIEIPLKLLRLEILNLTWCLFLRRKYSACLTLACLFLNIGYFFFTLLSFQGVQEKRKTSTITIFKILLGLET